MKATSLKCMLMDARTWGGGAALWGLLSLRLPPLPAVLEGVGSFVTVSAGGGIATFSGDVFIVVKPLLEVFPAGSREVVS